MVISSGKPYVNRKTRLNPNSSPSEAVLTPTVETAVTLVGLSAPKRTDSEENSYNLLFKGNLGHRGKKFNLATRTIPTLACLPPHLPYPFHLVSYITPVSRSVDLQTRKHTQVSAHTSTPHTSTDMCLPSSSSSGHVSLPVSSQGEGWTWVNSKVSFLNWIFDLMIKVHIL